LKQRPYIEPSIRTIAGGLIVICCTIAFFHPELRLLWLSMLFFIGANLFQSGLSRFCLMEKILKRLGFRSEMDEIRTMALHDALTNLPNRVLLEERINFAIAQASRLGSKVALMFIDLDNFKQINDIQGHKTGDQLLVAVSNALRSQLRPYDTLARWGGDEFVVLLPDVSDARDATVVADKLMLTVQRDLLPEHNLHTTLSIGVAVYPDDADCTESLMMQADKALFHSKSEGRNNIQVFSEMQQNGRGFVDTKLTAYFSAALKNNLLTVHFQPIVDAQTHKTVCIEALARWYDTEHGWISPGIFIPLAENLGLIEEVGNQILLEAMSYYSVCPWKDEVSMAVNISNRQLFSESFVPSLLQLVNSHGVKPGCIKIEITESTALDAERAKRTLKQLADLGFNISVDDFGTGFSSLSRLHEMPVDELKIDQSFVRRGNTTEGRLMLKTIVNMGRVMNLRLVAEGVEDQETADLLREMGVDYLQGYYFCKPQPDEDVREFIARGNETGGAPSLILKSSA
jgi:diguanylate cyclase (GGDEF)-like protein